LQIAVYDSGIGGLNVLNEALKQLPNENYLYYADTLHVPYGTKPMETVKKYIFEAVDFIARQKVKALVIACNTATVVAVNDLRRKYDFPIIGMEPAVKPAVENMQDSGKRVLVLATPLALKMEKFHNLLQKVDNEHQVDLLPTPELVEFAEKFVFDENILLEYFKEKLSKFNIASYGTIVLGCTHFLYFRDILQKYIPHDISIIDGNLGTINNLKRILSESNKIDEGSGKVTFYISGNKVENEEELLKFQLLLEKAGKML
jgi:glutamate racemase